jgi:hypothetical protein
MHNRKFLIPIALAISALTPHASALPTATPNNPFYVAGLTPEGGLLTTPSTPKDLFGFVLKASDGGEIFVGHRSHRSHRSHSSHRSHYSSR